MYIHVRTYIRINDHMYSEHILLLLLLKYYFRKYLVIYNSMY